MKYLRNINKLTTRKENFTIKKNHLSNFLKLLLPLPPIFTYLHKAYMEIVKKNECYIASHQGVKITLREKEKSS